MAIRVGRNGRQVWQLVKIILVLAAIVAGIMGIQVTLCRGEHPHKTMWECMRPQMGKK